MKTFISYRRQDTGERAKKLYDLLTQKYRDYDIFFDSATLRGGQDWEKQIKLRLRSSDIVLVLIGRDWLRHLKERRRGKDYVSLEIRWALDLNRRVIPVLMGGAFMPSKRELPRNLRELTKLQAQQIRDNRFMEDVDKLINSFHSDVYLTLDKVATYSTIAFFIFLVLTLTQYSIIFVFLSIISGIVFLFSSFGTAVWYSIRDFFGF